jgi:hypothetical protein
MKKLAALILLVSSVSNAKQIKIGVMDTGYSKPIGETSVNLCPSGHYDASTGTYGVGKDIRGHGTNIAHIIDEKLKPLGKSSYCLVIFKIFDGNRNPLKMSLEALVIARSQKLDFINYSAGGSSKSDEERLAIVDLLDSGVKFAAAAGNGDKSSDYKGVSLDSQEYYPALYDERIYVVGNGHSELQRAPSSNYGKRVKHWVYGSNIEAGGVMLSGSSQSTAIFTAKMAYDSIK